MDIIAGFEGREIAAVIDPSRCLFVAMCPSIAEGDAA